MRATILVTLAKTRKKKDGTYPIIFRLSFKKQSREVKTGYSIPEKDWDNKKRLVRKTFKGVSSVGRLNHELAAKKIQYEDMIRELAERGMLAPMTVQELKEYLSKGKSSDLTSFFAFTDELIAGFKLANKPGNARVYREVKSVLQNYCLSMGRSDLQFREISYSFLVQFEHYHLSKGNSLNGLSVYMRTIRAIYNKAIRQGLADKDYYPFSEYKIKQETTQKRAISIEGMKKIATLDLDVGTNLFHYKNYFLTSFYLCGISFIDMAFLQAKNVSETHVSYKRRKTGEPFTLLIRVEFRPILGYYLKGKKDDDFIFPIIKRESLEDRYKEIKWARKRYNKGLKKIGLMCEIGDHLTSYVARHTWATLAYYKSDLSLKEVSDLLGHANISTTEIYLKSLSQEQRDAGIEKVVSLFD